MNNHDVGLNYVTLMGVGIVAYLVVVAVVRAHAEYKRTQKRNASFFNDRGQAVVEFALVLPFLLLLALGVVEFGRAWMTMNILTSAAREGARIAAIVGAEDPSDPKNPNPEVEQRVDLVLDAGHVVRSGFTATYTKADGLVHVSVSTNFVIVSGKVLGKFSGTIPLSATSVFQLQS
jgi:Flp pilus assembly protein TadG